MSELHQFGHASTLGDHVGVLRRRKWIVIGTTLIVTLLALYTSAQRTTVYHATAQVLIGQVSPGAAVIGTPARADPVRDALDQALIASGPDVAQRVAAELQKSDPDALRRGGISVLPSSASDILSFDATHPSAAAAVTLANTYAREYLIVRELRTTSSLHGLRLKIQDELDKLSAARQQGTPVFATLTQQAQELQIAETLQSTTASLAEPAFGASKAGPKLIRDGILGLLLGGMLGIGLAFLWNALDTRIRGAAEVGDRLGLPLLARIPEPPRSLRGQRKLVMLEAPDTVQAEAFRMLRTNLEFANLERGARSIMVTSGLEEEGKSTTVANLAVAYARTGKRVALVDLDLRRPSLERFFGLSGHPGLTDIALGHVDLDEALAQIAVTAPHDDGANHFNGNVGIDGLLEVLTTGPLPPDAGEFMESRIVATILRELQARTDIVLIDAPPMLHVGDAMALTAKVDAVVVVTRQGVLRRPMLTEVRRMLSTAPALALGFVLTGAGGDESYETAAYYAYVPRRKDREAV